MHPFDCPIAARRLGDSSELRILDLSWNSIRDADIRPICNALKVILCDRVPFYLS